MVGLKTFWITISALFLFAACVPQTKQSSCKSNEAFNSSLRTCVPIVGGPESFVTVDNYVPQFAVTKYKSDLTNVDFTITISNPYDTAYTIQWERVFNGTPDVIPASTNATTVSLQPSYLGTTLGQIGTHLITAKILVGTTIVDSHSFELKINDLPKPTINNLTILPTPNVYNFTYTPLDGVQDFSFVIKNNTDLDPLNNWKTTWTVTKNGVSVPGLTDTDSFSVFTSVGTNSTALGDAPATQFNPSTLGVGSYTIRAVVSNDVPGEVVDERLWIITVQYPDVSKVTARDIYESSGVPSFTTVVNAYNGVAYSASTDYNFIPSTVSVPAAPGSQANFCVTVNDGDGTLIGGSGVRVDYYLDGITLVYSGVTNSGDNKICLSDSGTPASILFTNPSPSTAMNHTIVARLVDEDSSVEYTTGDLNSGLGTYPISWNINVKPDNSAPTVSFTPDVNLSGLSCGAASGTARTCSVPQDQAFVLGVTATDEFYDTSSTTDTEQDKFSYSMILYRNGSPISTCSKSFADVADTDVPGTDFVGPDYLCSFTVPSYDASGPVNPALFSYSVSITVSDDGSPITGSTGKTSATYTYNLSPVTEVNTAPVIDPQGTTTTDTHFAAAGSPSTVIESSANAAHFITEGETLNINVSVDDAERDHHQVKVSLCTDGTCSSSSQIALQNVTKTDNALSTITSLSYTLPENTIPVTTPIGTNVPVYFLVEVTDSTHTLGSGLTDTEIIDLNVRNRNPAPQFGGTPAPLTTDSLTAMVGYPLTIDPGTVTDASLVSSENNIGYQWYIDVTGAGTTFAAITGATSRRLTWTPSNEIASGSTVNLRICVHDNTVVNDLPVGVAIGTTTTNPGAGTGPNCLGNWDVTVRPNAVALNYTGGNTDPDVAIWQDTTVAGKRVVYTAFSDDTNIYIHKTVFLSTGFIYTADNPGFEVVSFTALTSGAPATGTIKDISLTGTADYLFIAYQAAESGTPTTPRIKVRRIDKGTGVTVGSKTDATYPDTGKFGYSYTQSLPTTNSGSVTIPAVASGAPYSVTFTGPLDTIVPHHVTVNGVQFHATDPETSSTLCGEATCTTNDNAIKLADLINSSSDRALQGLTAVVNSGAPSTVDIYGAVGGQNLDGNAISSYIVGKLGKIVTNGTDWYLPFTDLSTLGSLNRIRVLTAPVATDLSAATVVSDSIILTSIGAVNWFDNELNSSGDLIIASTDSSNRANIHLYQLDGTLINNKALFGSNPVDSETLRISTTKTGNNNYYAIAKVLTTLPSTYEWKIGRYDASLVTSVEDKFSALSNNAATTAVLGDDEISDITIQTLPSTTSTTEARILVSSTAGGADVHLYAVRFRSDNKLSCDLCLPLNTGTQVLSAGNGIGTTAIDTDMTIGTAGAVANENQKDVFFSMYVVDGDTPIMSIINVRPESINSTTTDSTGTIGHRPPFFGSN